MKKTKGEDMKKRDISLDYIRVIATVMIVVFHFASSFASEGSMFVRTANSTWGGLGTAVFFILSGFLLRKRHYDLSSLKKFYISRWLSIFPPFYMAFIVAYLFNVIRLHSFFYQAPAYTLIYTLLGIDNLLKWFGVTSYAIVGEWFTGIIIVLYILFPLLNKIMKRLRWTATVILLILYILGNLLGWYAVVPEISFISCTFVFWIGMLLADGEKILRTSGKRYVFGGVAIVLLIIMLLLYVPIPQAIATHIEATMLFLAVYCLFGEGGRSTKTGKIVTYFSKTSYAVYLVHHFVVFALASSKKYISFMNNIPVIAIFAMYIVTVLVSSFVLWIISERLVKLIYEKIYGTK